MNDWKRVWNNRSLKEKILHTADPKEIFLELKRSNGFDVVGDGISYEAYVSQYNETKGKLSRDHKITSVYEVGCGSGANLFLFERDGVRYGGVDYSEELIKAARQVLRTEDILCEEALNLPVSPAYDAVLSNSVFSYFPNESYAAAVLEKMCRKAGCSVGILDIHDKEKESAFLSYRKAAVPNYEERYKNLPKLFYEKQFFRDFAREHHMDIEFTEPCMKDYWNNDFVFNCYLYHRKNV